MSATPQTFEPIVRLTAQWRRGGAWLGPAWAVLCGVIASGGFHWEWLSLAQVAVALILAEGIWTTLWASLAGVKWDEPLARWTTWTTGQPFVQLPYTQPGSPAARLSVVLGQLRAWLKEDFMPTYGSALASVILAALIALALAMMLGVPAILLTVLALTLSQLGLALCRGNGAPNPFLRGLVEMTLPTLLGFVIYKPLTLEIVIAAIGFGITYAGAVSPRWNVGTWNAGQGIVLGLLIAMRHSVGAFALALLWLPQFLLQARPMARNAQWWPMATMLVAALAIA
ncbi:MAG: hypothetical protein RMN25_14410 [Anaerolineae bacterium]|nr:hypothetical protein [Thermoflexales bacterium]MDW8408963.1 hypothetical protein [Anaerolineae bacterium]